MLNEMMDRPVVLPKLVEYMRKSQRKFDNKLDQLQMWCNENRVPIIPHETAVFLDFQLGILKPKNILEIGTAVGYSAILMSNHLDETGQLITIERSDLMARRAKENIKNFGLEDKIKLIEGDAKDILPRINQKFDFIFMDSAKSKYIEFFPLCMDLLEVGAILMVDDIFQGGTILDDEKDIPRRNRNIHRKLNKFLDFIQKDDAIKTTLIPLGDGVVFIQKLSKKDYSFLNNNEN